MVARDMNNTIQTEYISALPPELSVVPAAVFIFILVSNILVLVVFSRMKKLQLQHYFMIGLAMADVLSLVPVGCMVMTIVNGRVTLDPAGFAVLGFIFALPIGTTSWIHSAMSIERCISIHMPMRHRSCTLYAAKQIAASVISLCFLLPVVLDITFYYTGVLRLFFNPYIAHVVFAKAPLFYATRGLLFILLPLAIQLITHIFIIRKILTLRSSNRKKIIRAVKTVATTVGLYYLCWSPVIVEAIWSALPYAAPPPKWIAFLIYTVLFSNSGMSFVIYFLHLPKFKTHLVSSSGGRVTAIEHSSTGTVNALGSG